MNYAKIRNYDIANGEGVRTSLFVSGCTITAPVALIQRSRILTVVDHSQRRLSQRFTKCLPTLLSQGFLYLAEIHFVRTTVGFMISLIFVSTHIQSVKPCGYGLDLSGRTVITLFSRIKTRMITNLHKWSCLHHVML